MSNLIDFSTILEDEKQQVPSTKGYFPPPSYDELFPGLPPSFLTLIPETETDDDDNEIIVPPTNNLYTSTDSRCLSPVSSNTFNELKIVSEVKLKRYIGTSKFEIWNTNGMILFRGEYPKNSRFWWRTKDAIQIFDLSEDNVMLLKVVSDEKSRNLFARLFCFCCSTISRRRKGVKKILTENDDLIGRISYKTTLWKQTKFTIERNLNFGLDNDDENDEEMMVDEDLEQERFETRFINDDTIEVWKYRGDCESLISKVQIHKHRQTSVQNQSSNYILMRFLQIKPLEKALLLAFLLLLEIVSQDIKTTRKILELANILFSIFIAGGLICLIIYFAV